MVRIWLDIMIKNKRKNPKDKGLEQFRLQSIKDLKQEAAFIAEIISENNTSSRFEIFIVGSILNSKNFNEDSDIDVAVLVYDKRKTTGLDEDNSDILQKIFSSIPFSFGVIDISVHNNILRINGNKLKIYEQV